MEIYLIDIVKDKDELARFSDVCSTDFEQNPVSNLAYSLVRSIFSEKLGIDKKLIEIKRGKNNKPFIKNDKGLHFNLSHTKNLIAIAVNSEPVGIDCEQIDDINTKHSNKIFTPKENEYIFSSKRDINVRFLECWTKKEAAVKLNGDKIITAVKKKTEYDFFTQTFFYENYVISVCSKQSFKHYTIRKISSIKCN